MKKRDYPPPKFVVCHNDHGCSVVPVHSINSGKIMSRTLSFECCLLRVLCLFDARESQSMTQMCVWCSQKYFSGRTVTSSLSGFPSTS